MTDVLTHVEPDQPRVAARHVAMLRAVDAGRAQLTCRAVPDLYVDGRCCTDHTAAAVLARAGLIQAERTGDLGEQVPAGLTLAGTQLLAVTGGGAR